MRLFIFPPSARVLAIVALKDYLNIECEFVSVDLSYGPGTKFESSMMALNDANSFPAPYRGQPSRYGSAVIARRRSCALANRRA
jgi:glutathione S-transferase